MVTASEMSTTASEFASPRRKSTAGRPDGFAMISRL